MKTNLSVIFLLIFANIFDGTCGHKGKIWVLFNKFIFVFSTFLRIQHVEIITLECEKEINSAVIFRSNLEKNRERYILFLILKVENIFWDE